jgi:hypothetical protein
MQINGLLHVIAVLFPRKGSALTPVWAVRGTQSLWTLCGRGKKTLPARKRLQDRQYTSSHTHRAR